jgi:hypothetical protein
LTILNDIAAEFVLGLPENFKNMIQTSKTIFSILITLSISSCFVLTIPTGNPNKPTTHTDPFPKDTTAVVVIDTTTKEIPTPENVIQRRDPDKLKVTFQKEASDVYLVEFTGTARAAAKTSMATRKTEMFESVGDVLKSLPTDSYMRTIGVNDKSARTIDENRNVLIKKACVFHISKESDEDFHIIIGDLNEQGEKINILNIEIAGLPKDKTSKDYFFLERTRRQFYEHYPEFFTGHKKTFAPISKFPEITVRGSLFFDTHHTAGQIGSGSAKPTTVWEIHPVTYIEFK